MKLLTISNLYPRPDRPQAGRFNAQLYRELAGLLAAQGGALTNAVPVPEWRPWRWPAIRAWRSPEPGGPPTRYVPAAYLPVIGRACGPRLYAATAGRALAADVAAADAVLAVWLYPDGVMAAELARAAGKPLWLMALGSDVQHLADPARRRQLLAAAEVAAGILCVSAHLAAALCDAGVPAGKLHVTPNGVDSDRFRFRDRAASRQDLQAAGAWPTGVGADARVVLFVGNLVPVKAPELLVAAAAQLDADVQVVLAGQGPRAAALRRQAGRLGVGDRVHLVGAQEHARVAAWMNAADVLVLCSRSEGMPNVISEALASGLPVAATDVGACRDMLAGEAAGRLVPSGDAGALAAALRSLLTGPVDRANMAARHGQRSWRDQAAEVLKLVQAG